MLGPRPVLPCRPPGAGTVGASQPPTEERYRYFHTKVAEFSFLLTLEQFKSCWFYKMGYRTEYNYLQDKGFQARGDMELIIGSREDHLSGF